MAGGGQIGLNHSGKQLAVKPLRHIHVLAVACVEDQQIEGWQRSSHPAHSGQIPGIELQRRDAVQPQRLQPFAIAATTPHLPAGAPVIQRQLTTYAGGRACNKHPAAHAPSLILMVRTTGPSSGNCS